MKTDFSSLNNSVASDSSSEPQHTTAPAPSKRRFGKKIYVTIGAIAIIAIIVTAVLLVPPATASTIPLGINYTVGEKLVYDVTTTDFGSVITNLTGGTQSQLSANSTISVYVVSLDQETYTLNYTETGTILGYTSSYSELQQVNKTDMACFVALLPLELQEIGSAGSSIPNDPFLTPFFNQSEAKVGDTWTIPFSSNPELDLPASITIKLSAIQNLVVPAGTYKVFRMDYSTSGNSNPSNVISFSGDSYLEYGSCKQIESSLQVNLPTWGYTIDTTLVQQIEP